MRNFGLSPLAALLLAGCTAGVLTLNPAPDRVPPNQTAAQDVAGTEMNPGQVPATGESGQVAPNSNVGSIAITVKWPTGYKLQAIPLSTFRIKVTVKSGETTVGSADIEKDQTKAYISGLPVGTYTVNLTALRQDLSTVVGTASGTVQVKTNEVAGATLIVTPSYQPHLTGLSPASGAANQQVTLLGSNLGVAGAASYSILVNGVALPKINYQPLDANSMIITDLGLQGGATTAKIRVSIDGISSPPLEDQDYTIATIDHINLTPATLNLQAGETLPFTATAYGDENETQLLDGVAFTWEFAGIDPEPTPGQEVLSLSNGYVTAGSSFSATITATVKVRAGGKQATATVIAEP